VAVATASSAGIIVEVADVVKNATPRKAAAAQEPKSPSSGSESEPSSSASVCSSEIDIIAWPTVWVNNITK
jgi:hypothetical protein